MPELIVSLHVTPEKIQAYYRGEIRSFMARASNGQTVQFPASVLHRFIAHDGVRGRFRLIFDDQQKFLRLEPVGEPPPG